MPESATTADLLSMIDASPSPYHAAGSYGGRLADAGFEQLNEDQPWDRRAGRFAIVRGGTLVAWNEPDGIDAAAGFGIIGAHTDSPNLRVKPQPDTTSAGYRQVGVEVYGGVLLNSWLDRDLGLSGRVDLADGTARLLKIDEPIMRIPQLAIHLDREISDRGLLLNKQSHMSPIWSLGDPDEPGFAALIADDLGVDADHVVSWDLMLHDLTPSRICGADNALIAAPRLDNQMSCWAGMRAMLNASPDRRTVLCLFDHEEIGSTSQAGAGSSILPTVLERIVTGAGGTREDFHVAMARSACVSADGAHATHPNYVDRHEPNHQIELNGGPVVKINANERYATTAHTHAAFVRACEAADVPFQRFVSRTDMPCGSTIGPVTSARLGVATVDAGVAQLAMHSARETAGAIDPPRFAAALTAFLDGVR